MDVAVRDGRLILIEFSSHVKASDIFQFKRKAELYEKKSVRKPDRLLIVTPYADEKASATHVNFYEGWADKRFIET